MIQHLKNDDEVLKVFSIDEYSFIIHTIANDIFQYQKTTPSDIGTQGKYAAMQTIELDDQTFRYLWIEVFWEIIEDASFEIGLYNMIVTDKEEELLEDEILDRYNELKKQMDEQAKNILNNVN